MKEIDWKAVAEEYNLTPEMLEEQVFITACIFGDMILDKEENKGAEATKFTCEAKTHKIEMIVRRVAL